MHMRMVKINRFECLFFGIVFLLFFWFLSFVLNSCGSFVSSVDKKMMKRNFKTKNYTHAHIRIRQHQQRHYRNNNGGGNIERENERGKNNVFLCGKKERITKLFMWSDMYISSLNSLSLSLWKTKHTEPNWIWLEIVRLTECMVLI